MSHLQVTMGERDSICQGILFGADHIGYVSLKSGLFCCKKHTIFKIVHLKKLVNHIRSIDQNEYCSSHLNFNYDHSIRAFIVKDTIQIIGSIYHERKTFFQHSSSCISLIDIEKIIDFMANVPEISWKRVGF